MRKIADELIQYFILRPDTSIHQLAKIFDTSRSHVKSILRNAGLYNSEMAKMYDRFNKAMTTVRVTMPMRETLDELKVQKRIVVAGDFHIPYHDPDAVWAFLLYIKKVQPDVIIIDGDFLDCYSISRFTRNPHAFNMEQEFEVGIGILEKIREFCPNAEIFYLEGNHEFRIKKFLGSMVPQMADFCRSVPEELNFEGLDIKYVIIPAWMNYPEDEDACVMYGPLRLEGFYFIHGDEAKTGFKVVNIARTVFMAVMDNVICGHFHRLSEFKVRTIGNITKESYTHGCLCMLNAEYHILNQWEHGFLEIVVFEDGNHAVLNHRIVSGTVL